MGDFSKNLGPDPIKNMNCKSLFRAVITFAALTFCAVRAQCQVAVPGTFKHITIDGSFADWTGVPLAYTATEGSANAIQYENVYMANDESNLYIQVTLYTARPSAFQNSFDNIFIDADDNASTGFPVGGIGSEMLIQWGGGYQEKNGGFNEGDINNLGWNVAGSADSLDFEMSISLNATYASDGTMVFSTNSPIAVLLEGDTSAYANSEFVPPSGGLVYAFAANPGSVATNAPLITLENSSWEVNASGTDLGTNWLGQNYDDTQAGWTSGLGLFGYTPSPSSYPPIQTPLSSGPETYYFRTHFQWTNDSANIAFVVSNYISDGAVFYLNGNEVTSIRMPAGAVSYGTLATGTNVPAGQVSIFGLNGATLQAGDNILEVEAHQAANSSADMIFGLSLTAAVTYPVYNVDTNQPYDQTVLAGKSVTFTSDIIGSGPLTYQWIFDGTNAIAGATSSTYTIPSLLTNNAGTYTLVVSNASSRVTTRSAVLTVSSTPVIISSEPASVVAVEGTPAAFTVSVTATPTILYQWFHSSTNIAGATNASYTIASVAPSDAGSYYVTVSNPADTTNSVPVTLTVLADRIPPALTGITASYTQVVVTFSKPLDPVSSANASHYTIGGISVIGAVQNPSNPSQVTLTTGAPMNFGSVYTLTVSGVDDLYGNAAGTSGQFTRDITIDGSFNDWIGLAPIYTTTAPSGNTDAADFNAIYAYNDANFYYFRVTLWTDIDPASGQFPYYVNMFFDTDNNPDTGYSAIGSEMLIQSGYSYQEKNGNFNDGVSISGLDWLCLPQSPSTNFEFQIAQSATFQDGTALFTTNAFQFLFEGMTPSFVVENTAPAQGGTLGYTNVPPPSVAPLPLGKMDIAHLSGGNVAIIWNPPGSLQSCTNLSNPSWTNVSGATSPYVVSESGKSQFFRIAQ